MVDRGARSDREPGRTVSVGMRGTGGTLRRRRSSVHHIGEFVETAMKLSANIARAWMLLAALVSCAALGALGQSSSEQDPSGQSLGDVARKTRQERSATNHVPASK